MKSLSSVVVSAIAGFLTIPVTLISSSPNFMAYAASPACAAVSQPSASEGGMGQNPGAIDSCHLQKSSVVDSEPEMQSAQSTPVAEPSSSTKRPSSQVDDFYPAYCPTLPAGLQPDDYQFRRALERCKFSY